MDERKDIDSRKEYELDIDRYVNEGLNGGRVDPDSGGKIEEDIPLSKEKQ
ncbi:hypothetical protein ABC345_07160 [Shouchella sp. 1P09AA]|nr:MULTISPECIES: hypothetical protein [Bacillaceae]UTR07801.1 hypothetical protein MM326_07240 [Alkalihalobacillus sp. LMS6]